MTIAGHGEPVGAEPNEHGRAGWWLEVLLALEIAALSAFTFGRPVLDSFGESPETFIARGAAPSEIVLFAVLVVVLPAALLVGLGVLSRVLGARRRRQVHIVLVAALGGLAVWRLGQEITGWPGTAVKLQLAGILAMAVFGLLRHRVEATQTFLRIAGVMALVFPLQFLLGSATSGLVIGDAPGIDPDVARQVAADLGKAPPPIVVVVFDAFPTAQLLDGAGHIDAEVFPNLAALADTSTWYRNHSTVSAFTAEAVPAILTGRYPDPKGPSTEPDDENLFTLLGGSYRVQSQLLTTRLCPEQLCPTPKSAGLGRLLHDAADLWTMGGGRADGDDLSLPSVLDDRRYEMAEQWIEQLDVGRTRHPDLTVLHVVLPHGPWEVLDDGTLYEASYPPFGWFGAGWPPDGTGIPVLRQRFILQAQASDRLLGQLMDRLERAGTFDDALVVVTADHGESFTPGEASRLVTETNTTEIMWTPLIVKYPDQATGVVDDANVMSIDVVPTIAAELGVELPWEVDGVPADQAGDRDQAVKWIDADKKHLLQPPDGEPRIAIDAQAGFDELLTFQAVEAQGPDAVWKRTRYGDLFGTPVDDLTAGAAVRASIELEIVPDLEDIDLDDRLALEIAGHTSLGEGVAVAFALNGTIGAVVETEPGLRPETTVAHGLVPPDLFVTGHNELTAYLIEGPPAEPVLRPVDLVGAP